MGECSTAAKGEFEGLFQEETTEDHEVVAIAVFGLHNLGRVGFCGVHVYNVFGFAEGVVGVWIAITLVSIGRSMCWMVWRGGHDILWYANCRSHMVWIR